MPDADAAGARSDEPQRRGARGRPRRHRPPDRRAAARPSSPSSARPGWASSRSARGRGASGCAGRRRQAGAPAAARRAIERHGRTDRARARRRRRTAATAPGRVAGLDAAARRPCPRADPSREVATSPAVGIYRPAPGRRRRRPASAAVTGSARVDMLGVAQEVVAPADGIVGASLAEPGDAVEYGQELLVIEFAPPGLDQRDL